MNNVYKSIDNLFETSNILNEADETVEVLMRLFNCNEESATKILQAGKEIAQGEKSDIKRVIELDGKKYRHKQDHKGYHIYVERTPNGYDVSQSFLICDPNFDMKVQIESYNHIDLEEVLDMVDEHALNGHFSGDHTVRAFKKDDFYTVHPSGNVGI